LELQLKHHRLAVRGGILALAALTGVGTPAQTVRDRSVPETALDLPANLQIFGKVDPNVRKPTAIVNDTVITGTDVDERVALILAANPGAPVSAADRDRLKLQVLRQLIDETLQIQEARTAEITITQPELQQSFTQVARRFNQQPATFGAFLQRSGSSQRSLLRQIEGELAWQRYLRRRIEPLTNIGEQEVKAILERLEASRGTEEFNLNEIYLEANDATQAQTVQQAREIIAELQKGQRPFSYFARTYSDASTAGVGGELGWVRTATLPAELAQATQTMQVGQVAGPIPVPGGLSILYLTDKRQVLTADPRDARLSLKQLTLRVPAGASRESATARIAAFGKALQGIQGCGSVEAAAAALGAEVVDNDAVTARELPPQLTEILLQLQVGQATPPFGTPDQLRALVLCGRDDPRSGQLPSSDQVENQLQQQRVNLRAQQKLRDLRRDAVVEYR
jgi:peptidyl-prolyl cis-trans isomerase SurA